MKRMKIGDVAENCVYATHTDKPWVGALTNCHIVECRNEEALENLKSFTDAKGVVYYGVRRPCDERFNLLPDTDYLQVRSRFCNKEFCPFFT